MTPSVDQAGKENKTMASRPKLDIQHFMLCASLLVTIQRPLINIDNAHHVRFGSRLCENAKQLCPGQKNLNRWLAQNTLKDTCLATMPQDPTERTVSCGMFDSLGEWVHALHNYRHGQPADIPVAPSLELATYALSTGSSHLRMLTLCLLRQP